MAAAIPNSIPVQKHDPKTPRFGEAEVIASSEGYLKSLAHHYSSFAEVDDLMQVGRLSLLRCYRRWEDRGFARFSSYAWMEVRKEMRRYAMRSVGRRRDFASDPIDCLFEGEAHEATAFDSMHEQQVSEALRNAMKVLTDEEREVIVRRFFDEDLPEVEAVNDSLGWPGSRAGRPKKKHGNSIAPRRLKKLEESALRKLRTEMRKADVGVG